MIGRGELPLSPVFRESFLRRCAPHGGELREFGELLARLAGPPCTHTFEAAREQYRAAVREYRQAEEALRAVRKTAGVENRTFHLATVPVLRTMDVDGRELEMVLWKTEPGE
jgi:hypothetical protein